MSQAAVFARARPSVIRVTEEYVYQAEVSSNPRTLRYGAPSGTIEVVVPYDGHETFGSQAIDDVERQVPNVWEQGSLQAVVGHIGLVHHGCTDLAERLDLAARHDVLPLEIPIQGAGLAGPDALRDDRRACRVSYRYTPQWPETSPLTLGVSIWDEETIQAALMDGVQAESTAPESVARDVAQQVGFSRSLIFSFSLQLALPARVGRAKDDQPPVLTQMALKWPSAPSHQIQLQVAGGERPVPFNPEIGAIEWGDIAFIAEGKQEGTGLFSYRTPSIDLYVDQPGELYRKGQLTGRLRIEMPRTFSGLAIAYFEAGGRLVEKAPFEPRTVVETDLTLYLEDCFQHKVLSPYQHLQFEGVILNEIRVADIVTLLRDLGFTPGQQRLPAQGLVAERYLVRGERPEGLSTLYLWMLVEGTRSQTTRRKQIPGGQEYTTQLETGSVAIYMRGQLAGDGARLIGAMNEIQTLLKERFQHVSTID